MTRKRRRLYIVGGFMLIFATAAALVLMAFEENIVFFYSPSDLVREMAQQPIPPNRRLRIGGLVEEGSLGREKDGVTHVFRVTDKVEVVSVRFRGLLPDIFGEGQGIVAEGSMAPDGTFIATEVLAKHDETYMPKEVAEALKKAGQWQGNADGK
jgi:cytochrome c-type biogenesis protein CcmE